METLFNGFTLEIPAGAFPLSTDSMALTHFIKLPRSAKILDLGSGCGTLGVLLCAKDPGCTVTGYEFTELSHRAAVENIRRNRLETRMESICADLRQIPEALPQGGFSLCVSNPPYFSGGPVSNRTPLARREDGCTLAELLRSAAWALKYGGDFYLVHRPERLGEIIALAAPFRLEVKRLGLLRHKEGQSPSLVLLQLRKGGKPGLRFEEITLYNKNGTPTQEYRNIYHI